MKKMILVVAVAAVAAGLGPQSYVQDGLVTHFDAFDNEGTGTHNPSATTWRGGRTRTARRDGLAAPLPRASATS